MDCYIIITVSRISQNTQLLCHFKIQKSLHLRFNDQWQLLIRVISELLTASAFKPSIFCQNGICLENEISVIVIIKSFTCSSWEDSLCFTLWKVTQYKLSVKWEGAAGELLLWSWIETFGLKAHRKRPLGEGTCYIYVESKVFSKWIEDL